MQPPVLFHPGLFSATPANMQTVGERIRIARQQLGLSQPAFARPLGVTTQSVNQWEKNRKTPSVDTLRKIRAVYGIPSEYLLYGGPLPERGENGSLSLVRGGRHVPLVTAELAMRRGEFPAESKTIYTHFDCGPDTHAFPMPDTSMEPDIRAGELVFVDPDHPAIPGAIVLAVYGVGKTSQGVIGELRYETGPTGTVTIITPRNQKWPAARSDLQPIEIVSVVVASIKRH